MKLDIKDKKLLYEIDLNARAGTSELAKKIGLSQENVFYRLKRLEKNNIISGYLTLINFSKIGYSGYAVYARFHNVTHEKKEEIINELKNNNNIYWIAEFGGKYDIAFAFLAKDIIHFNNLFLEITSKYNNHLKDFTIEIRVELNQFPRDYLIKTKKENQKIPLFGKVFENEILDELDKEILKNITNNPRISVLKLSENINKPTSTIRTRLKQLEEKKIIQGYSAMIQCNNYNYSIYQLFITATNITKEIKKKIFSYCAMHSNIIILVESVGKWNFEIMYEVENQKQLQDFIMDFRTKFSDIILDVESIVMFDHYTKYTHYPFGGY
jgi:Lrp/AsnC family transcriptional regulator, leucine-responsive regulatory protein